MIASGGVAAVVLAAGRGTRFGAGADDSKLAVPLAGAPIVRRVAETALGSAARPVIVVCGHAAAQVAAALVELDVTLAHNPRFAEGMAGSLRVGLGLVPEACRGALVLLADMPLVRPATLDALIARFFAPGVEPDAVVPVHAGLQGNPVLISRSLFPRLEALSGDIGARAILGEPGRRVVQWPVEDPGVTLDVDTPDALARLARM